jgi:hypothetical protein
VFQAGVQGFTRCHRVADPGVHSLPTKRTVVVRGIAGQHDPPGVEPVGDTVPDQEARAPDNVLDHRPRWR